ncbi:DUF1146 family protein [Alkalihalobacillus hemicellulosilyticus]|uniref:Integral membrane protein n=1 Tax=Halalkalibacter hemicellulosilyticusJCM 9152 TaxID=1236971 RepID=W4QGV1_9BACI|nr:DUF1146 family protein [Halalkalibacter hemicellulosilyticus]GAE31311.1 hypothetical protein JCM9152_2770 [Halalkalibacter hemicellulosilyticusJCM 9152]
MLEGFGQQAMLSIIVNVFFIAVTWWALQSFRFDLFVKDPEGPRAKVLMIIVTIAIAQLVSQFFLDYMYSSQMLRYIWE